MCIRVRILLFKSNAQSISVYQFVFNVISFILIKNLMVVNILFFLIQISNAEVFPSFPAQSTSSRSSLFDISIITL